ncbi:MAG: nucleoside monophosphate kinase, partial [Planctomycetes bacterium]|nr:nucleoside monophosphate kinase [Planctomycetota bacterium]
GPPGSGKGTQARRMAERFGHRALSSGEIFRAEIAHGSVVGQSAAAFVNRGALVPDDIVIGVMLSGIEKLGRQAKFILDGFPRTVPQADGLSAGLVRLGTRLDAVIDFRVEDVLIIERAVNRRICGNCGRLYNVRFFPPRREGTCDQCGGAVVQRDDDREDVIRARLETYRAQTRPLVEYYAAVGLLRVIDAAGAADVVEADVAAILESGG